MKAHIEIRVRLHLKNGETLHDVLRQFAHATGGWKFLEEESETYQTHIGGAGGYNTPNRRWRKEVEKAYAHFREFFPFLRKNEFPRSWPPKDWPVQVK